MRVGRWKRKFSVGVLSGLLMFDRHMGFEELAMKNIDEVLKGREPLTPVNKHLIVLSSTKKA